MIILIHTYSTFLESYDGTTGSTLVFHHGETRPEGLFSGISGESSSAETAFKHEPGIALAQDTSLDDLGSVQSVKAERLT